MLNEVRVRLQEISDLSGAAAVLNWDQATHMPTAGQPHARVNTRA
jgi:Zn-dependent M32 family carboxypeptidase